MPTIDAQVHAYERNHPGRPWAAFLHGPASFANVVPMRPAAAVTSDVLPMGGAAGGEVLS